MKSSTPVLALLAFSLGAAFAGAEGAPDRIVPGRFPSPSLDASGRLSFLYQDSAGAIRLGTGGASAGGTIVRDGGGARTAAFPRLKEDRTGALWASWAEGDGQTGEVILGRFGDDGLISAAPVSATPGTDYFPDLDFDSSNRAWIAWAHQSGLAFGIFVREPGSGRILPIGPEGLVSVSGVRILAGGSTGVWVFWSGRDTGRDEIFWSRFDGTAWSPAAKLSRDGRIPHLFVDAALDPSGRPWVVWSAFDGLGYRIRGSRWDGSFWSAEEALTQPLGSDAFPALAFDGGDAPLLVWSRTAGAKSALCARPLDGPGPGREIEILSIGCEAVADLELTTRGGRLAVLWQTGDGIRSLSLSREEILAGRNFAVAASSARSGSGAATDEDIYIAFGDDNTFGVIDGGPAPGLGYVPRLEQALSASFGGATVWNEGVIGESTIGGLGRIADVLAARGARYIFLMEGTNDVVIPGISTDATAFNLEQMIRRSFAARALPVIATIIPRSDNFWNQLIFRQRLYDINDAIAITAINLKVPSVDMFSAFWNYPEADGGWTGLLSDGVHPNELGYDVMSQAWANGVRNLPFPPSSIVVKRSVERSLVMSRHLNYLTWSHSPKITNPFRFRSYRIYRKDRDDAAAEYELVASIPYSPFHNPQKYNDLDIDRARRYEYVVTLLRIDGIEGPLSDPAPESD